MFCGRAHQPNKDEDDLKSLVEHQLPGHTFLSDHRLVDFNGWYSFENWKCMLSIKIGFPLSVQNRTRITWKNGRSKEFAT